MLHKVAWLPDRCPWCWCTAWLSLAWEPASSNWWSQLVLLPAQSGCCVCGEAGGMPPVRLGLGPQSLASDLQLLPEPTVGGPGTITQALAPGVAGSSLSRRESTVYIRCGSSSPTPRPQCSGGSASPWGVACGQREQPQNEGGALVPGQVAWKVSQAQRCLGVDTEAAPPPSPFALRPVPGNNGLW